MLIVALSVFGYSIVNAQIKRQYQDAAYASTMVVVKENGQTDVDILNSQFNLNDVSMGQVIRITTEGTIVNDASPSVPVQEVKAVEREILAVEKEEKIVVETKKEESEEIAQPKLVSAVTKKNTSRTATGRIAYNDAPIGTYTKMSDFKRKKKKVRIKKAKRAKRNNYNKCFAF